MGSVINIIFDGSFVPITSTIGLGIVKCDSESSKHSIFSHTITSKRSDIEKPLLDRYGSFIAELYAAQLAMDRLPEDSHVKMFGDCATIIDIINGWHNKHKFTEFDKQLTLFKKTVSKHKSVQAFHVASRDAAHLHPALKGIAHNASAAASGARKIERTPGYDGAFSHRNILFQGHSEQKYFQLRRKNLLEAPNKSTRERIEKYFITRNKLANKPALG